MDTWNKRLLTALSESNLNRSAFARAVGVSNPTVTDWLNGRINELKAKNVIKICRVLNINQDWLINGKGPRRPGDNVASVEPISLNLQINDTTTHYGRKCPVVGTARLGDNGHYCELDYPPGDGDGYIIWPSADQNCYAIRCVGDSMQPRIRDGEYAIVEPNHEPIPGDEVLVRTEDGRVMVKIYLYRREGKVYLGSVNDNHPTIAIEQSGIAVLHYVAGFCKSALWRDTP